MFLWIQAAQGCTRRGLFSLSPVPSQLVNEDKDFHKFHCHQLLTRCDLTPAQTCRFETMAENDKVQNDGVYVGEIKGGLKPSMRLIVMGIVNQQPKSIAVALACHPQDPDTDVGLQVTVCFHDRAILRNAKVSGEWGVMEKNIPYFPFAAGEAFKMEILCEHQRFRILVDGQPLCGFSYRVQPLASLTALHVSGDMQLTKVA
ncbi:galectin-related protein B [Lepisosteus oculatus]